MKKRVLGLVMAVCLVVASLVGCGNKPKEEKKVGNGTTNESQQVGKPDKVYTMQVAHGQPTDNPRHISLESFKEQVESKTNGGIIVDIYPAGQLGTEKEMLEQVCSGVIQGFRGGPLDFLKKLQIFTLPFLCETQEEITRLCNSDFAIEVCEGMKDSGAVILALGDAGGFRQFSTNSKPIKSPEDMKGLKMRTNGLDTVDRMFKALGANTVSVPYNDLYMGLKTGVADGQENPWVNVAGMKFYEVQKYFTEINAQFFPDPFYVNLEWYKSLPKDYQKILKECTKGCMEVNNKAIGENQIASLKTIKANAEVYTLTKEERQKFINAVQVVYDNYIKEGLLTKEELDTMRNIIAKKEKQ